MASSSCIPIAKLTPAGCFFSPGEHFSLLPSARFSGRSFLLPSRSVCQTRDWRACSLKEDTPTEPEQPKSPPKRYVRRAKVQPRLEAEVQEPLQTVGVEAEGVTVEGVAAVDRGATSPAWGRVALLVAGDAASLLLFSWLGRASHSSAALDLGVLSTASPFLLGYFITAPFLGAYSEEATAAEPKQAALGAAKAWAGGVPAGLAVRGVLRGQVPPTPFILVTLASTLVLLAGWRAAFATTDVAKRGAGDRKGNPFEFLGLLASLVRRW